MCEVLRSLRSLRILWGPLGKGDGEMCPQANVEIQEELCIAQRLVLTHSTPLSLPGRSNGGPQVLLASLIVCPPNYMGDKSVRGGRGG